jgi:D-alanyl-D-alanine dipeptidase
MGIMHFIFVDWIKWCRRTCFFLLALMMEAAGFSEISVPFWHHVLEKS